MIMFKLRPTVTDQTQTKNPLFQSLRKSCHFCRSRKTRCSGESICSACRERGIECSYRVGGPKGRPKRTPSNTGPPPGDPQQCSEISAPTKVSPVSIHSTTNSMAQSTSTPFNNPMREKNKNSLPSDMSVASRLQFMMDRLLSPQGNESNHSSGSILDSFRNHLPPREQQNVSEISPSKSAISYEELFFIIGQECIEMLALRFGELGCHQLHHGRSRYVLNSLSQDSSTVMFDPSLGSENDTHRYTFESGANQNVNPLREYNNHMTIQMLEIWFSQHPFAFMFSKTLLLRDIRHDTHSELLLAAMLADVQFGQETQEGNASGNALTRWANTSLHEQRQEDITLTTIQAATLLGWRALCTSQARRAICYFIWANCTIQTIPEAILGLSTINGIDVGEIESECRCNAHWLILSINLWISMQVGAPGSLFPPESAPTIFPSAEESSSANFTLDRKSYNLSTLQNQERMFRELWLLSHVTATVSHIFALYSNSQLVEPQDEAVFSCWQSHILRQLQNLASPPPEISMLCRNIRNVLLGSVELVETHAQQFRLEALALSASYTMMMIHFLVPSPLAPSSEVMSRTNRILAAGGVVDLVSNSCYSASALLKVLATLNDGDRGNGYTGRVMSQRCHSSTTGIFALALDACGRVLNFLYTLGQTGSDIEQKYIFEQKGELARLAADLLAFGNLSILSGIQLGVVKRQLKLAVCQFSDPFDFASSSGSASLMNESEGSGGSRLTSSLRAGLSDESLVTFSGNMADIVDGMTSKHSISSLGFDFRFMGNGFDDGGLRLDHSVESAMQVLSDQSLVDLPSHKG